MGTSVIAFRCEHCRKSHEAPARHAGKLGKCSACQKRMRVPDGAPRPRLEPALFQHTTGSEERQSSCLLVVEADALRVLGWKGPALPAGKDLIERAVAQAGRDERIHFERVAKVTQEYHGGLKLQPTRGESVEIPLGTDEAPKAMAELGRRLRGFRASTEEVPPAEALALPLVATVVVLVLGGIAWAAAGSLQGSTIHGRGLMRLVASILAGIGPNGVLVLAGLLIAPALLTIASRVTSPPRVAVLARG